MLTVPTAMDLLSKVILVFSCLTLTAIGAAFPIMWIKTTPASTEAQVIRDASSNFYVVTRTGTLFGRQINVTKYNALGTQSWAVTYPYAGNLDTQFSVRSIAITPTHLIVVAQERANGGSGSFVGSRMIGVDITNGSSTYSSHTAVFEFESVAVGNGQFAQLRRNPGTGDTEVQFFDLDFNVLGTASLGVTDKAVALAMDANNFAYAACSLNAGTVQISRCNSAFVSYQTVLDVALVNNEVPTKIAVDTSADRVYALGYGNWHLPPNDVDVLYYMIEAASGNPVFSAALVNTAGDDEPGDLAVVSGGGFVASGINATANETIHRRFNASANQLWTHTVTQTPAGTPRFTARDADGNLLLLSSSNVVGQVKVARVNVANGNPLGVQNVFVGDTPTPRGLLTDAAGNFYINADSANTSYLMRVQVAALAFASTIATGGSSVQALLSLANMAAEEQTWTLTSSNPSLVSVPPTLVIPVTHITGNFQLTVNPVTVNTNVTINVRHNGFISQRVLTVIPSNIQSVSVSPQVVIGGVGTTANLTLTGTAPAGGRTVTLVSDKPTVASIPASADVQAGQSTLGVPITTFGVNANQGVVITATTGAVSKTAFFAVNAPSLTLAIIAPGTIQGGSSATLTLGLNGIAPTGGFSIVLFSGAPAVVFLSASATVPAGQVTRDVSVPTAAVSSPLTVTIFATRSGIFKTTTITVTP